MSKQSWYIPAFDGLRCIAIVGVLLEHFSYGIFHGGFIGVDLFFVLSGYLITSLLLREYETTGRISFRNFYVRRVLRLLPPLVVCLVLGNLVWSYALLGEANRLLASFAALFYCANIVVAPALGPFDIFWSLSVEEHFYLVWPLLAAAFLFKVPFRTRLAFLLTLIFLLALSRAIFYYLHGFAWRDGLLEISSYRFTLFRADTIFMGALAALVVAHLRPSARSLPWKGLLSLCLSAFLLATVFATKTPFLYYAGFELIGLLCTAVVVTAAHCPDYGPLSNRAFLWVGRRSYGIYVYHRLIIDVTEKFRHAHDMKNFVGITLARLVLSFLIADVSFRFIETPILRWKKRFEVIVNPGQAPSEADTSQILLEGVEAAAAPETVA